LGARNLHFLNRFKRITELKKHNLLNRLKKITDLKSVSKGRNKKKYFARGNLKGIFCRDKTKLAYFIGGKDLFTL
jgi:hypothetical protein